MTNRMSIFSLIILITFIGCVNAVLDYDKIEFEIRKITLEQGLGENPTMEIKVETRKPLYKYYEKELSSYRKVHRTAQNNLDTLYNHKGIWLDNARFRKEERVKFASDSEKKIDSIKYGSLEEQYLRRINEEMVIDKHYSKIIDSIAKLYKDVSEQSNYFEIEYEIREDFEDQTWIHDMKVLVNEESNIFEHEVLNQRIIKR